MYSERDRNDDYYSKKSKKPEQNYYQAKQQQQQVQGSKADSSSSKRYDSQRQASEPRLMSNSGNFSYNNQDSDRNRGNDQQKGGMNQQSYEHRNKPPTGPRINNAGFKNFPLNIDALPPRLKRKYLKECGLPEELADKPIAEIAQQSSGYSATLPYGNRNRFDQHRQQNFQNNNYQSKYNNNQNQTNYHYNNSNNNNNSINNSERNHHRSRSITPPSRHHQQQKQHYTPKNEWKSPNEKSQQHEEMRTKTDKDGQSSFDWSEDVMASHSLPPDVNSSRDHKYDDNNHHRHRRRRNRR